MPPVSRASQAKPDSQQKYLRLRPTSLLAACFLLAAAVVLAYVGGVMSGRAYTRGQAADAAVRAEAAPAGDVAADAAQPKDERTARKILAPEELRFARVLRGEIPPQDVVRPAAVTPVQPRRQTPQGGQLPPQSQPPNQVQGPAQGETGLVQPVPPPAVVMHDHIFPVGAFKDSETVDGLRQRLEGRGFRTRMQRSGKLYTVQVLLRGDSTRAAEVIHACEEMGLGRPILLSRKPTMR